MKKSNEAFKNWLMSGSDPLEEEMIETLSDEEAAADGYKTKNRRRIKREDP